MLNKLTFLNSRRNIEKLLQISLLILILFGLSCQPKARKAKNTKIISLETKIGQMIMVGFRGLTLAASEHIQRDIQEYQIGGVVLYSIDLPSKRKQARNIESPQQLHKLNENLQKMSKIPLFIGIDQEGGRVNRLSPKYGFPKKIPSAQYLGKLNDLDSTRHYAKQTAQLLKEFGINFNFAPVVDVNINPACPVIGGIERSFSSDPAIVTKHAAEVIRANKELGIYCSLKHFPGHGSAKSDSHLGFTDVSETWGENELLPYQQLIEQKAVDIIMTAHVFNKKLDPKYPATLSKKTTHHFLREQYKWDGFIISDDMHMGAISDNFKLEEAIEKALEAGVDMLMFSNNSPKFYDKDIVPKAIRIIQELVKNGIVSEKQINESYDRIMKLKTTF